MRGATGGWPIFSGGVIPLVRFEGILTPAPGSAFADFCRGQLDTVVEVTFNPDAPEGHFAIRQIGQLVIPGRENARCRILVPKRFKEQLLEAGVPFDEDGHDGS